MGITVTHRGIRVTPAYLHRDSRASRTVNVEINGHRVWSTEVPNPVRRPILVPWPQALSARLSGTASCRLVDAATASTLWKGEVYWGGIGSPDLADKRGRLLTINKWGLMRPTFENSGELRQRVADSAADVLGLLSESGFVAFIVGGTLLGAVRDGAILPHDDDADLAYLSPHSHPSDLIAENYRLAKILEEHGYRVLRHSWSHLQVLTGVAGEVDYYVDIFTAFYKSGHFHEPIHVRSPGMVDAITPLGMLEMHGHRFPVPRDPEAWLSACYGNNWRVPDPTFTFETPLDTRRRFNAWFGSYNQGLNSWEDRYREGLGGHESSLIRTHIVAATRAWCVRHSVQILDIGAGAGDDAAAYRSAGFTCHTSDYAMAAPIMQHTGTTSGTQVNLVERVEALRYFAHRMAGAERTVVAANHVLACVSGDGLHSILQIFAALLRSGARVIAADYAQLGQYEYDKPRTWHLDLAALERATEAAGLHFELLEHGSVEDEDNLRRNVNVVEFVLRKDPTAKPATPTEY